MEEVNDIASDQEKQSPAFGLKTQGEEIIKGVENSENMLVIGFPGVGKTLLLHSLMKLNSNPHSQWEYHHACNIVVKTTDISNVFDPIIHKFDDNYDNAKLILVIDELDVLTSWKKKNSFEYFHRIALELSKVEKQLVLIGVTNRPHLIGLEFLQLFKTKVYIPLPNK
jgi:SpoVK/Ycf46/Vps4 family AAA+-type ATPase